MLTSVFKTLADATSVSTTRRRREGEGEEQPGPEQKADDFAGIEAGVGRHFVPGIPLHGRR
jgi:hypothetical protein